MAVAGSDGITSWDDVPTRSRTVWERIAEFGIDHARPVDVETAARLAAGATVYVASPYGDSEPAAVRLRRYSAALDVCGRLIDRGVRAYSPIVHTHHIAGAGHKPPDGWYAHDLDMIGRFDTLVVAMIPGWDRSRGVGLEMERAGQLSMPVLFVESPVHILE